MDYVQDQPYDSVNATPVYAVITNLPASYSIAIPLAERLDPRGDGLANDDGLQKITVDVKQGDSVIYTLIDYKLNFNP